MGLSPSPDECSGGRPDVERPAGFWSARGDPWYGFGLARPGRPRLVGGPSSGAIGVQGRGALVRRHQLGLFTGRRLIFTAQASKLSPSTRATAPSTAYWL